MAFRKRNVAVGGDTTSTTSNEQITTLSGIRASPLSSQLVTSTGTASLDDSLGGYSGLALGSSLLIEESGTTDYAGALLRFYASEGLCHGHVLHVVGVGDDWVRHLPGFAEERRGASAEARGESERMKIAWRYQNLGQTGARSTAFSDRNAQSPQAAVQHEPFCHNFDLTKRLPVPPDARIKHIPVRMTGDPFHGIVESLGRALNEPSQPAAHRLVIPTILSPAIYPTSGTLPEYFLHFLQSLRALHSQHSNRLTTMLTLPLELFPRSSSIVRWAELLCDGVIELTPFPHLMDPSEAEPTTKPGAEEQPQGLLRVHKLPIATERGEGGAGVGNSIGEDLSFTVSRRKFIIKPFALPPLEGDQEAQKEAGKLTGKDVEF